jgi:Arc/MetJ family transcription regulator
MRRKAARRTRRTDTSMARVQFSLDADLVIEAMLLAGVTNAQDAVEVVVRDYVERGNRTEAVTGNAPDARRTAESEIRPPDAG